MINNNLQMSYTLKNKASAPKTVARKIARDRAVEQPGTELKNKSAAIIERLTNSDDFNYADKIFAYFSVSEKIVNNESLNQYCTGTRKICFIPGI